MSHIGRPFEGHPLEDACPCPQEPCGLVAVSRIVPACHQHALAAGKTIRQSHTAERCPMTAPTSPKPPTPADLTVSKDAATTLDNGAAEAGLRTALTTAIDRADPPGGLRAGTPSVSVAVLRALLAAHPAPERDEDLCTTCGRVIAEGGRGDRCATCALVSDTRRGDGARALLSTLGGYWCGDHMFDEDDDNDGVPDCCQVARLERARDLADVVLAVLPAPPVVDEAAALERAAEDMEAVIVLGDSAESTAVPAGTTGVGSAIGARDALYENPVAWLTARAARLRGATR